MRNENRQERLAKFNEALNDRQKDKIIGIANGDEALKSVLEGFSEKEATVPQEDSVLEAIKKQLENPLISA